MFPGSQLEISTLTSFPRIRGDVPLSFSSFWTPVTFSPHTRGCSGVPVGWELARKPRVFPAYAGMFRALCADCPLIRGFPRIRGDVPGTMATPVSTDRFSPHTRGCSERPPTQIRYPWVFPAYAGMFLGCRSRFPNHEGFPRIRGDVPRIRRWS